MAKEKHSGDKVTETTLHELLLMMDARLKHIEDIEADNRETIIKLVKQGNQIVEFLKQIEIEDIVDDDDFDSIATFPLSKSEEKRSKKIQHVKEIIEEYMSKHKELKEFEKELKKYKNQITPGCIGES